jgi:hypothetical protein
MEGDSPKSPPETVKKLRQRELGGLRMPGGGSNSSRLGGTKTGSGFSVAGVVSIPLKPKRKSACFLQKYYQVAGIARRNSRKCFAGISRPSGFGGVNLTLPRATKKASPSFN